MEKLMKSVSKHGILSPCLARSREEGGYELVAGNRRKRACELAGIAVMPVIIREMDDDEAAIIMVDTNLTQREKLLYSEKAWAYRVKMEALNHRGIKSDTPGQLSVEILAEQTGESKTQIYRFIQLTELVPALMDRLDAGGLKINPAYELSFLSRKEQTMVADNMTQHQMRPSLTKAKKLREASKDGILTPDMIESILIETGEAANKPNPIIERFSGYFPADYTEKQMERIIVKLLESWQKNKSQKVS
jgi:ParB family chromosome partitioning protein